MKRLLQVFFVGVFLAMLGVTVTASFDRDVLTAAGEIWADPWGKATLFDAYFAFLTVFVWIAWRERSWAARAIWLLLILTLGNFAIAAYFLIALHRVGPDGSWTEIFDRVPAAGDAS
ncbi:MAG: DUF1475 family protein [Acidobacteriota bacterium]